MLSFDPDALARKSPQCVVGKGLVEHGEDGRSDVVDGDVDERYEGGVEE